MRYYYLDLKTDNINEKIEKKNNASTTDESFELAITKITLSCDTNQEFDSCQYAQKTSDFILETKGNVLKRTSTEEKIRMYKERASKIYDNEQRKKSDEPKINGIFSSSFSPPSSPKLQKIGSGKT